MKKVTIDLTSIHTPRGMHAYLAYIMALPTYYGRNLDALYDVLTDICEPTLLVIRRRAEMTPEMAAYFPKLSLVLHDAQAENRNLQAVVEMV